MKKITKKEVHKMNHLTNRFKLIEKIAKSKDMKYEPSEEELHKAYGYLSYCLSCGKKIRIFEPFIHGFEGNHHKFGCNIFSRVFGYIYFPISTIIKIPFLIIGVVVEGVCYIWKKLK